MRTGVLNVRLFFVLFRDDTQPELRCLRKNGQEGDAANDAVRDTYSSTRQGGEGSNYW